MDVMLSPKNRYGYSFGCAHVNLSHIISNDFMLYPGYQPPPEPFPLVIHYGITFYVDEYAFDKHWFQDLTSGECPGTNIGLPLSLEEIAHKRGEADGAREFRRSALALYAPQMVHAALQDHQRRRCGRAAPPFRHKCVLNKPPSSLPPLSASLTHYLCDVTLLQG